MKKANGILPENIHTYWEYPAPDGRCWSDRLREQIDNAETIGIEPTLRQEIVKQISGYSLRLEPLVERLRLVKTRAEVKMIERAAMYADYGVEPPVRKRRPKPFPVMKQPRRILQDVLKHSQI